MAKAIEVVTADAHTDRGAWKHRAIYGDGEYSLEQIADYAISHELDILALGDLIDVSRPPSEAVSIWHKITQRLQRARREVRYIEGQHELAKPPWLSLCPATIHVSDVVFEVAGIQFYGLNFQPKGQLQEALGGMPETTDVFLAHQVWSDFMGDMIGGEGAFSDVPYAKLMFTGDYHKTVHATAAGKSGQKLEVYSPGSTHLRSIDEPPAKYFYVLYDDLSVKPIRLKTRLVLDQSTIADTSDLDHFLATIGGRLTNAEAKAADRGLPEHIAKPLIRVRYSVLLDDAYRRVRQAIGERAHIFWAEMVPQQQDRLIDRQQRNDRVSQGMAGCLELVVPETDSRLYKDTHRLLLVPDDEIAATVADIAEEFRRDQQP